MVLVWVLAEEGSEDVPRGVVGVYLNKAEAVEAARRELAAYGFNARKHDRRETRTERGVAISWFDPVTLWLLVLWPWKVE